MGRDRALAWHDRVRRTCGRSPIARRRARLAARRDAHDRGGASSRHPGVPRGAEHAHGERVRGRRAASRRRLGLTPRAGASHTADPERLATEEREWATATALLVPVGCRRAPRSSSAGSTRRGSAGIATAAPPRHPSCGPPGRTTGLVAVFLGRVEPRKGLHHALDAWIASAASERGTPARLRRRRRRLPGRARGSAGAPERRAARGDRLARRRAGARRRAAPAEHRGGQRARDVRGPGRRMRPARVDRRRRDARPRRARPRARGGRRRDPHRTARPARRGPRHARAAPRRRAGARAGAQLGRGRAEPARRLRQPAAPSSRTEHCVPTPRDLAVIVCTRNRATMLARRTRVDRQRHPRRVSRSSWSTPRPRRRRPAGRRGVAGVAYVRSDIRGLSIARDLGLARHRAPASCSSPTTTASPSTGWIDPILARFDDPTVGAVTGAHARSHAHRRGDAPPASAAPVHAHDRGHSTPATAR